MIIMVEKKLTFSQDFKRTWDKAIAKYEISPDLEKRGILDKEGNYSAD